MTSNNTFQEWLTWSFSPSISAIAITLLISILSPILIHLYLYHKRTVTTVSNFLLLGPSGAGKTSLLTLFEQGKAVPTHTSQEPQIATCRLRPGVEAGSQGFRSHHDPTVRAERQFQVIDTPGHGKLRHHAIETLNAPTNLRGLIFVVDSAALSSPAGLTEAATYLHDVLLLLQKRYSGAKTSKGPSSLPVLIAANKADLFTALPDRLVKKNLEEEITKIRTTRSKSLLDSGIGMEDQDEEREWLGEGGEGSFSFEQMEEVQIEVKVAGGHVLGEGAGRAQVDEWWTWIGENM